MATASPSRLPVSNYPKPVLSQKHVLWTGIAVMALFVLPLFSTSSPHRKHLLAQNLILIPHVASGLAAFLIGPLQFSTRLRQCNLRLPHGEISSACLPRHPAVAYLCLVRPLFLQWRPIL